MRSLPASAIDIGTLLVERNRVSRVTDLSMSLMHVNVETQNVIDNSFDHQQLPLGNWYITEQPLVREIPGHGKLTIELARLADIEGYPLYRYSIHDKRGRLLESRADLDGPERPDNEAAMELLVDCLVRAGKALDDEPGIIRSHRLALFTWPVVEWSHECAAELDTARLELVGAMEL